VRSKQDWQDAAIDFARRKLGKRLKDKGTDARLEAAMAKLYVSETFVASCLDAMRTFGSYGYMTEQELEREMRDAIAGLFYSGTSDIQRNIIARGLGL
jgi:alkylation response protein AidB-like acyl-CoA dehydrogenase